MRAHNCITNRAASFSTWIPFPLRETSSSSSRRDCRNRCRRETLVARRGKMRVVISPALFVAHATLSLAICTLLRSWRSSKVSRLRVVTRYSLWLILRLHRSHHAPSQLPHHLSHTRDDTAAAETTRGMIHFFPSRAENRDVHDITRSVIYAPSRGFSRNQRRLSSRKDVLREEREKREEYRRVLRWCCFAGCARNMRQVV